LRVQLKTCAYQVCAYPRSQFAHPYAIDVFFFDFSVPVVQRIEQGFPKGKRPLLHKSADVISCAQIAAIEPVELLLGSSRVIRNVHIFTHPGDTTGDTKLSTVFVSTQPMTALASTRGKQFAAQVSDEITDVTASPYLSGVFGATSAASFWKHGSFRSGSNMGSSRSSAGISGGICPKVRSILSARARRRFSRSADRCGAGPRRAAVLGRRSSARLTRREHAVQFPVAAMLTPFRPSTPP